MNKNILLTMVTFLLLILLITPVSAAQDLYKIAVLPFDDGSIDEVWWGDYDVGSGVSDELVTALLNLTPQKFRVMEREQIQRVLEEQEFGASGLVDASSAAKIGKILGVQFLLIGKVTEFTNKTTGGALSLGGKGLGLKTTTSRVVIDARLVDTNSAEILAAVKGEGEKKQANISVEYDWNSLDLSSDEFRATNLGKALREAVDKVVKELEKKVTAFTPAKPKGLTALVAYADASRIIINIGSNDGVKEGMSFEVHKLLQVIKDPTTGEIIDSITEPVAEIKVTQVKDKSATCSIVKKFRSGLDISAGDQVVQK
jgi:curli biogenesis system outer membrane secretion channel CsgG